MKEDKQSLYDKWAKWKEGNLRRPSSQLGLVEAIFALFFLLIAFARPIDWTTIWKHPVGVDEPSPWGLVLMFLGIGCFCIAHAIGNFRNAKFAVGLSGIVGLGLFALGILVCWYQVRYNPFPEGQWWTPESGFSSWFVNWGFILLLLTGGGNLAREAKHRFWPKRL